MTALLTTTRVGEMIATLEVFVSELQQVDESGDKGEKASDALLHAENLITTLSDLESVA